MHLICKLAKIPNCNKVHFVNTCCSSLCLQEDATSSPPSSAEGTLEMVWQELMRMFRTLPEALQAATNGLASSGPDDTSDAESSEDADLEDDGPAPSSNSSNATNADSKDEGAGSAGDMQQSAPPAQGGSVDDRGIGTGVQREGKDFINSIEREGGDLIDSIGSLGEDVIGRVERGGRNFIDEFSGDGGNK